MVYVLSKLVIGIIVSGAELDQKFVGSDLHGFIGVGQASDQAGLDAAAQPGFIVFAHARCSMLRWAQAAVENWRISP